MNGKWDATNARFQIPGRCTNYGAVVMHQGSTRMNEGEYGAIRLLYNTQYCCFINNIFYSRTIKQWQDEAAAKGVALGTLSCKHECDDASAAQLKIAFDKLKNAKCEFALFFIQSNSTNEKRTLFRI
jgi:hypothetical protein